MYRDRNDLIYEAVGDGCVVWKLLTRQFVSSVGDTKCARHGLSQPLTGYEYGCDQRTNKHDADDRTCACVPFTARYNCHNETSLGTSLSSSIRMMGVCYLQRHVPLVTNTHYCWIVILPSVYYLQTKILSDLITYNM